MAIKKAELRPKLPNGTYDDVVYLKTSIDMVEGLNIKNNLTETVAGSVLDATQGKVLSDKIGDTTALETGDKTNLVNAINELKRTGGGGGSVLSTSTIFDVEDYQVYTATSATNTFGIPNMTESQIIQIVYNGLEMIKDVNYTIDKAKGIVTLGFSLKLGEKIYYKVLYGADNAVVYDTTDTVTGGVSFDADTLQGNSVDAFVRYAPLVDDNANTYKTTCNLKIPALFKNMPSTLGVSTEGELHVFAFSDIYVIQEFISLYNAKGKFYRSYMNGTWTDWQQIATTDMIGYPTLKPKSGSANDIVETSDVFLINGTDTPYPHGRLQTVKYDGSSFIFGGYIYQTFIPYHSTTVFKRVKILPEDRWTGWQEIATTKKEQLSLVNGWVDFFETTEPATISRSGNIVTIKACIKSGTYTNGTTIFNIPSGYRPSTTQTMLIDVEDESWVASRKFISIYTDGRCVCNSIHNNLRVTIYISYSI